MLKLIPDEEIKRFEKVQWAPMVDFLFIIVIVFATIAVTRTSLRDTDVALVRVQPKNESSAQRATGSHVVNLSVSSSGHYRLISKMHESLIDTPAGVSAHLLAKQQQNHLPKNVKVLLHIDKKAPWQPIAEVIFALRESGFHVNPVYQSSSP